MYWMKIVIPDTPLHVLCRSLSPIFYLLPNDYKTEYSISEASFAHSLLKWPLPSSREETGSFLTCPTFVILGKQN